MSELFNFHPKCIPYSLVNFMYIETGVGEGTSFKNALRAGFRVLHGIECNQICYDTYQDTLCSFVPSGVEAYLHLGSSIDLLDEVIDTRYPTTFWLDAHYTGHYEYRNMDERHGECPLLLELEIIVSKDWDFKPIILVDDAVIFTEEFWERDEVNPNLHREEWPVLRQILRVLRGYTMTLEHDILYFWN